MKCLPFRFPRSLVLALALSGAASAASAQGKIAFDMDEDLKSLSIEELMDLDVTIASRSDESLSDVPGAVYVLTGDEIRRAGHSSIPEALRMVPGFHVSRWTTSKWDVTSRGFGPGLSLSSSAYLNQLLVMIDGVVVYTPLFAGVWWSLQDIDLADVDRIEIIRGPGGILWGSNATHGVVHVITKKPADTQGGRVSVRHGTDDRHAAVRYGGEFGENGTFRVWSKGAWCDTLDNPFLGFDQDWYIVSTGFRADWEKGDRQYSVSTRFYDSHLDDIGFDIINFVSIPVTDKKRGYQVVGSVTNTEKQSRLQAWFSSDQQQQPTELRSTIDTFDIEYQRQFEISETSRVTAGAGYRLIDSFLRGPDPFFLDFDPQRQEQNIFRAYVLDKIQLPSIDSVLTLGLTVEHNDFTQFEVQPTVRINWSPEENLGVWAAVSRAVRTPSLEENSLSGGSVFIGDDSFESESLIAYEAGVRALVSETVAVDLAVFFNDYDDLHYAEDLMIGQFQLTNEAEGTAYGAEVAFDIKPTERWTVRSAYSFMKGDYESKADGSDLGTEDYHPEHRANVRSYFDLGHDWEIDGALYLVESLGPGFKQAQYTRADLRFNWKPNDELEFFVGGQNLNDSSHSEFDSFDNTHRSIFAGVNWTP